MGSRISLDEIICKDYVTNKTLKTLTNTHLLRVERNSTGGFSYELSHDTLIEAILDLKKKREELELIQKLKLEKEQEIIKTKKEEEQKKLKETYNSLYLAKNILDTLTVSVKDLREEFKEFVVFEKSKNIINGDFFFFKKIDNIKYFGIFDSTGSGVPAAFIRMFGYSKLNDIITDNSKTVNEILNIFRELVINLSKKEEKNTNNFLNIDILIN